MVPSEPKYTHLDLFPQKLQLLRLGLILDGCLHLALALGSLMLPRLEELQRVRIVLDGRIEERDDALLAPRELSHVVCRARRAPIAPRGLEREPRELDKRLAQPIVEACVEEAAASRSLVSALLPLAPASGRVTGLELGFG